MVGYTILLNKLDQYGIKNKYYDWFTCCLNNGKQFVTYVEKKNCSL